MVPSKKKRYSKQLGKHVINSFLFDDKTQQLKIHLFPCFCFFSLILLYARKYASSRWGRREQEGDLTWL